ncbi:MAG: SPW repeat protein [Planctomycetes bacterium]|nr:SPW repeat protein [Planctomycetota bacterium]
MWPRIMEVMLGLWLVLSPLIFRLEPGDLALIVNHLVYGAATAVAALIAIRVRFLRVVTIAIGLWLIGYGYVAGGYPGPGGYLNLIVIGVLLCALGLIPTDCLVPTHSWREYYASQRRE